MTRPPGFVLQSCLGMWRPVSTIRTKLPLPCSAFSCITPFSLHRVPVLRSPPTFPCSLSGRVSVIFSPRANLKVGYGCFLCLWDSPIHFSPERVTLNTLFLLEWRLCPPPPRQSPLLHTFWQLLLLSISCWCTFLPLTPISLSFFAPRDQLSNRTDFSFFPLFFFSSVMWRRPHPFDCFLRVELFQAFALPDAGRYFRPENRFVRVFFIRTANFCFFRAFRFTFFSSPFPPVAALTTASPQVSWTFFSLQQRGGAGMSLALTHPSTIPVFILTPFSQPGLVKRSFRPFRLP